MTNREETLAWLVGAVALYALLLAGYIYALARAGVFRW